MSVLSEQFDHYRGRHRVSEDDPTMDRADEMFPGLYERPDLYRGGYRGQVQRDSVSAISAARGRPDHVVTVYRAVPGHVGTVNPGDWVSTSFSYAHGHGVSNLSGPQGDRPFRVLSMKVPAGELHTEGNSIHEWAWHPKGR